MDFNHSLDIKISRGVVNSKEMNMKNSTRRLRQYHVINRIFPRILASPNEIASHMGH